MLYHQIADLRDAAMSPSRAKAPFWIGIRLGLGLAQMFVALFSAIWLLKSGLSRWSVACAGVAAILTSVSRLLFHSKNSK